MSSSPQSEAENLTLLPQNTIKDPKRELTIFLLYAVLFILVIFPGSILIRNHPLALVKGAKFTDDLWYLMLKVGFLLTGSILIYRKLGYSANRLLSFKGVSPLSIIIPLTLGCLLNFSHVKRISQVASTDTLHLIFLGAVLPLISAAIPEEMFYRAMLQTRAEIVLGKFFGVLCSSLLFSLFHFPSRYILSSGVEGAAGNVMSIFQGTLLPTFILGLIFGALWWRMRNLWMLIALHYGIDLLPSISSLLGVAK